MIVQQLKQLLSLIYPEICEGCGEVLVKGENSICISCIQQLAFTNFQKQSNNPLTQYFVATKCVQHTTACFYFSKDTVIQTLLHTLKSKGNKEVGIALGKIMGSELAKAQWITEIDALIPVPLSDKKQAIRGYNQSQVLLQGIQSVLKVPIISNSIIRNRNTDSQTQKTREQRVENMKNAFSIKNENALKDKHILLVDDVITTGATLDSIAQKLNPLNIKISIACLAYAID